MGAKGGGVWLVAVVVGTVVVVAAGQECTQMRQECRLKTQKTMVNGLDMVTLNVSCYCERGEDVSGSLEEVAKLKCSWLHRVNLSALHISGCSVRNQVLPSSVWDLVRQSQHLVVHVERSPNLRLGPYITPQLYNPLPSLTATFIDSKVSGVPEGVLAGSEQVRVVMDRCELSVLEARAFSGYSPTTNVSITMIDTNILTLKMVAFDLPATATVVMEGCRVNAWEELGYSGGSHLSLNRTVIGRLLPGAVNIHGLKSFLMTNCTIAEVYGEALRDKELPQTHMAMSTRGESSATFTGNSFVNVNGKAFVNMCGVDHILWANNTFVNVTMPPIRLQEPECETKRDWANIISLTGINCFNCEDFNDPDEQTCAIYQTGYCTTCEEQFDNCNAPVLPYLVQTQCAATHPSVVTALKAVCNSQLNTRRPEPRSLIDGGMMLTPSSQLVVAVVGLLPLTLMLMDN